MRKTKVEINELRKGNYIFRVRDGVPISRDDVMRIVRGQILQRSNIYFYSPISNIFEVLLLGNLQNENIISCLCL